MIQYPVQHPILLLPSAVRVFAATMLVVSRGALVLLALYHIPMVVPALYNALEYQPLSPPQLERLLFTFFVLPELAAFVVQRVHAAVARIEEGELVIQHRGRHYAASLSDISAVTPWSVPLPRPGLRVETRSPNYPTLELGTGDPMSLLAALTTAGVGEEAVGNAPRHPMVRYASARWRARGALDHPFLKFVLYALVPAVPLFRLRQLITYGGVFGEYHEFGLMAYLLGFGIFWLLSAIYLLLFASFLRALGEAVALVAAWTLPGWHLGVRRSVEILQRLVYYLTPPILMFVRLVL